MSIQPIQPTGPKVGEYAASLEAGFADRQASLSSRRANLMAKLQAAQAAKNASAPVVSGGSGTSGVGNTGSGVGAVSSKSSYSVSSYKPSGKLGGAYNPAPGARISQNWGKSNIRYAAGRHTGMDFAGASGSRINSAASGVVVGVGREGAYGNTVRIRQADGTTALYGHLAGFNVKKGQKVKAGQQIAKMGSTGRSTGTHLHFEVRSRDRYGGDINTNQWLRKNKVK